MASRKRKGDTTRFVIDYLGSDPGSTSTEILNAGEQEEFSRASILRHLRTLSVKGLVRKARRRYWLGRVEDPELAVEAEVERTFAILRSPQFSEVAKLEAARQLARESNRASPRSRTVIELLRCVAGAPKEIRIAILPFVQRSMREAVQRAAPRAKEPQAQRLQVDALVGARYPRRLWEVVRDVVDPFLRAPDGSGTMAWNAVYEALEAPNLLGDEELLELAELAVDIETRRPLPPPSAARAVLRRIAKETRLRERILPGLLRRLEDVKNKEREARVLELIRAIDAAPFGSEKPNGAEETEA